MTPRPQAAHTPGPWHVEATEGARTLRVCDRMATVVVAQVSAENESDARLIAQAPALLAALEEIATKLQGRTMEGSTAEAAFFIARKAVAAARGQS